MVCHHAVLGPLCAAVKRVTLSFHLRIWAYRDTLHNKAKAMIHALTLILACQLAGEAMTRLFGWPAPGPVLGMALLFALMLSSGRIAELVTPTGTGILRHLSLLFVPAGVGVIGHLQQLGANGLGLALALIGSTVLALAMGAGAFVVVARLTGDKGGPDA
jgi:holin-like protein